MQKRENRTHDVQELLLAHLDAVAADKKVVRLRLREKDPAREHRALRGFLNRGRFIYRDDGIGGEHERAAGAV
jgi:hypothetical protein